MFKKSFRTCKEWVFKKSFRTLSARFRTCKEWVFKKSFVQKRLCFANVLLLGHRATEDRSPSNRADVLWIGFHLSGGFLWSEEDIMCHRHDVTCMMVSQYDNLMISPFPNFKATGTVHRKNLRDAQEVSPRQFKFYEETRSYRISRDHRGGSTIAHRQH